MRVLYTGKGNAGSWEIRGNQLGGNVGDARITHDFAGYDVVVIVKTLAPEQEAALQSFGGLVVWDIIDNWPQRTVKTLDGAIAHVHALADRYQPHACVFATDAMRESLDLPGFTLRHHARPGQYRNPIRQKLTSVCYEGNPRYLPGWIAEECGRHGLTFTVNPQSLSAHDVVISARGAYASEVCTAWKSNVKLANAQATRTPALFEPERGYTECDAISPVYYRTRQEFGEGLERLRPRDERLRRAEKLHAGTPWLDDIAAEYRERLREVIARNA